MKKYKIYRIDENGDPKKKQTTHAETITSAWAGSRCWHSDGTYLITSGDGSEAQIFILNRGGGKENDFIIIPRKRMETL